jgi:iron(III) transport system ATP-binding protein
MNALELNALYKTFGSLPALDDVNLSVPAGSRTAIVGPSGSGKTTLLRMIAGFEFPDTGSIRLSGQTLVDATTQVPAHQRSIGYVPQDGALFPHMTVAGNIGFGLSGTAVAKQQRIAELLESVVLEPHMAKRWPHELSGGQQQRVALARALAQRPRLMLLDEPFSALDTGLRASMRKMVAKLLSDAGVTTILVTHDQAEALSFADQLAVMRQGRLVQAGQPMDLYLRPHDSQTAFFLGDAVVMPARVEDGWATCDLGRIQVNNPLHRGPAHIMLRPEQLHLVPHSGPAHQANGCLGVVTDRDFGGNVCTLTVELHTRLCPLHGHPGNRSLLVRSSGIGAPPTGSTVHISALGDAHVLADTVVHDNDAITSQVTL